MAIVHIKWEMPYNWYSLRKLRFDFGNGLRLKVPQSIEWSGEVDALPEKIRIKLDFLSNQINIIPAEEIFLVAGLKGDSPGQWYRNSLKRHGLFLRQVEELEYRQFSSVYYARNAPVVIVRDWYSLILISVCSMYSCYAGIIMQQDKPAFSEFSFASGLIGFFTLLSYLTEKSSGKLYYLSRQLILIMLFLATAVWASLSDVALSWFVATLPLVLLLRSVYFEKGFNSTNS